MDIIGGVFNYSSLFYLKTKARATSGGWLRKALVHGVPRGAALANLALGILWQMAAGRSSNK